MAIRAFRLLFFVLLMGAASQVAAQDLTGIWRGYFITGGAEQYKYEVQIDQSSSRRLTGVTYSYLDTRFYGKATFTGNFNTSGENALIQEIKTVEVRMSGGSMACIMKCNVVYSRSGNEEFLEGDYTSSYEKDNSLLGIKRGGNCGGGRLFLRKVPTSDFYVEPFLRTKPPTTKPSEPVTKKTPPKETTPQKPAAKKSNPPVTATKKPPVKEPAVQPKAKKDTLHEIIHEPIRPQVSDKPVDRPVIKLPASTRSRSNELIQTLTVQNSEVKITLYDNGEIDDDTISVYLDNKLVLASKRLSATPLSLTINMEQDGEEHVLVMVAENLGRIPPNTSLMIVNDGQKRYEVRVTSTSQKNAMVRFRYKGND
jgi:hypothetical protein